MKTEPSDLLSPYRLTCYFKTSQTSHVTCHFGSFVGGIAKVRKPFKREMTIMATPIIKDGDLSVKGKVLLTSVPSNIIISPAGSGSAFIGATSSTPRCRHVFSLGVLQQKHRLLCLYRFKIWWMIPRVAKSGRDIPVETQLLLLEAREDSALNDETIESAIDNTSYILLLPVLDGEFRTSLQGCSTNELQFCVESGDPNVQSSQLLEAVFVNSGSNPFELIKESIKILEKHKGTFSHIDGKKIPANLDWFGWCTWDAFYTEVSPQGIIEGLQSLSAGGCPARFLIIDDGWQDTVNEFLKEGEILKDGVQFVYMWHALVGYWGGLHPTSEALKKYNPKIVYPIQSPGNIGNLRDIAMDGLEKYGVGIVDPSKIKEFYNDLHSYLASKGVDGVKVDVQNVIETMASGYGGRVSLARQYQLALEDSIARNFKDNNLICCMSHNSDYIYSSKKSAVARVSEDFMPREPTMQTLHIAAVSFNSLLLGEIVVPDWDMFHSNHETAEFHGAARAIGGCGVYVSDKPGMHDFKILKKLVLQDGSILRARYAGRPTRDTLFDDPVMDGKSLMKIWNLNKLAGVVGVFNCQGAGTWPCIEIPLKNLELESNPKAVTGFVSPSNVEFLEEITGENWIGECVLYAFNSGSLYRLPKNGKVDVTLGVLQCEIYTVSPIREYNRVVHFAPIGLVDMYNSGGAIEALSYSNSGSSECVVKIEGRGCGRFGAYSKTKPKFCLINGIEVEFDYDIKNGFLTFKLSPCLVGETNWHETEFYY